METGRIDVSKLPLLLSFHHPFSFRERRGFAEDQVQRKG